MTNTEFVQKAKKALNYKTIYAWGGFGNKTTTSRINQFSKRYPDYYSTALIKYLKENINKSYMIDCCGLIKSVFMGTVPNVDYVAKYDKDARGITIGNASATGNIKTLPEIPGVLLYMDGHCGIYLGNKQVLESTPNEKIAGRKFGGVCISKLSDRKWEKWAKSKWLVYEEPKKETVVSVPKVTPTNKTVKYKINSIIGLNIRNKPSIVGKKVGAYKYKTIVEVTEVKKKWGKTNKGWISLTWCKKV